MEHNIEILLEVWSALRPHLIGGDVEVAADDFVHVVLEHGVSASALLPYVNDDDELATALKEYAREDAYHESYSESEYEDSYSDDDDDYDYNEYEE